MACRDLPLFRLVVASVVAAVVVVVAVAQAQSAFSSSLFALPCRSTQCLLLAGFFAQARTGDGGECCGRVNPVVVIVAVMLSVGW